MTTIEKRSGPRVTVEVAAMLQVLGEVQEANGPAVPVQVLDAGERGMRLQAPVPIAANRAVKIELGQAMFLGEVCYCAPVPGCDPAAYYIGIATEQCLTGLSGLQHLIAALQPEPARDLQRI